MIFVALIVAGCWCQSTVNIAETADMLGSSHTTMVQKDENISTAENGQTASNQSEGNNNSNNELITAKT